MDTSMFYYPFLCLICLLQNFPDHGLGITVSDEGNQTVQIEVGDDTFFPCSAKPRAQLYDWKKGGNPVQADDAYRSKRLFIIRREGLLLLNVEETDSGVFICQVYNRDGSFIEIFITLEVIRKEEEEDEDEFKCGIPRLRGGRIIAGSEVRRAGSYPWMALLLYERSPDVMLPFCGGTLLSRSYVVTAATCFRAAGYTANNVVVRLGEHIISQNETYERTVRIAEIIVHPDYNIDTFESDIALIRLEEPVTYSNYILPLCIPGELRGEHLLSSPSYGIVTGWGREDLNDGSPPYSDELNWAKLNIIDQAECAERHIHAITNVMFCALGGSERSGVRDACQGDTGGPFLMREDGRSYLVGIISWGIGCANAEFPGVYTRVPRFTSWILEIINAAPEICTGYLDVVENKNKELQARVKDLETQLSSQVVSEDAWSAYQFHYDNNWNSCNGTRYVRKRPVASGASGQYVGAILCTHDRYKLYLANDLYSEFKNIAADTSGHGSDHCEFVGAHQDDDITIDSNVWYSPSAQGYYRRFWGDDILEGSIGGGLGAGSTGRYYPKWYECGVSIP